MGYETYHQRRKKALQITCLVKNEIKGDIRMSLKVSMRKSALQPLRLNRAKLKMFQKHAFCAICTSLICRTPMSLQCLYKKPSKHVASHHKLMVIDTAVLRATSIFFQPGRGVGMAFSGATTGKFFFEIRLRSNDDREFVLEMPYRAALCRPALGSPVHDGLRHNSQAF